MEKAIQKAIEGGWNPLQLNRTPEGISDSATFYAKNYSSQAFIDPLFWQALGKALGWGKERPKDDWMCPECMNDRSDRCVDPSHPKDESTKSRYFMTDYDDYKDYWHRFIDHLAEGKDPDSFFKDIIN